MRVVPYGEGATWIDLELGGAPDRVARTHAVAAAIRARLPRADVVVGAGVVVVAGASGWDDLEPIARDALLVRVEPPAGRAHVVRAAYDGPDLDAVAEATGLSRAEVIARHAAREYVVEIVGFLPGFAYLGPLDPALVLPRRASPRPRVPAGAIAIAGAHTGIYPFASPGGWHLIGRAVGATPFDPRRDPPGLFAPGDRVRFEPALEAARGGVQPGSPQAGAFRPMRAEVIVASAPPGTSVQDQGRPGRLSIGLPPSGPLDATAHAAANLAVGNDPRAAAIEVPLGPIELVATAPVLVSVDGESPRALVAGESLRVEPSWSAVRYVAVAGGVDVPAVLGARATLAVAGVGGVEGRYLRAGDRLPVGAPRPAVRMLAGPTVVRPGEPADLFVLPGPHLDRLPGALEALLGATWTVSRLGDRVGVRLEGARLPREGGDLAGPAPMVRGAVQVTTDGTPVVLGPDHPVTGGYPVVAVVRPAGQALLARLRPGARLRFAT